MLGNTDASIPGEEEGVCRGGFFSWTEDRESLLMISGDMIETSIKKCVRHVVVSRNSTFLWVFQRNLCSLQGKLATSHTASFPSVLAGLV